MTAKKFILSGIAGFGANVVTYFILEQLIFKSILEKSYYQAIGASVEGSPVLPIIAVLVMVFTMAYLYPKGYGGGSPAGEGLRFGFFLGLFFAVPFSLFTGAQFSLSVGVMLLLILVAWLEIMASGLVVGLVYGKINSSN